MRREDRYLPPACEPAMLCVIALLAVAWGCGSMEIRLAFVAAGIVGLTLLYREYLCLRPEAGLVRASVRPLMPSDYRAAGSLARSWNSSALGVTEGRPPALPTRRPPSRGGPPGSGGRPKGRPPRDARLSDTAPESGPEIGPPSSAPLGRVMRRPGMVARSDGRQVGESDLRQRGGRVVVIGRHPADDRLHGRLNPGLLGACVGSPRAVFVELPGGQLVAHVGREGPQGVEDLLVDRVGRRGLDSAARPFAMLLRTAKPIVVSRSLPSRYC